MPEWNAVGCVKTFIFRLTSINININSALDDNLIMRYTSSNLYEKILQYLYYQGYKQRNVLDAQTSRLPESYERIKKWFEKIIQVD